MITKQEVLETCEQNSSKRVKCFSCKKRLESYNDVIQIAMLADTKDGSSTYQKFNQNDYYHKIVLFHYECWKDLAGDEYIFEESKDE